MRKLFLCMTNQFATSVATEAHIEMGRNAGNPMRWASSFSANIPSTAC